MRAKVKNIRRGTNDGSIFFIDSMQRYVGTSIEVMPHTYYYKQVRDGGWSWLKEWLEFEEEVLYNVEVLDIEEYTEINDTIFDSDMSSMIGDIITVTQVDNNFFREVDGEGFIFHSSWIKFIEKVT